MCDLKICRVCLRTECKFYKYDQLPLKFYYEEVIGFKSKEKEQLPKYFCYECAASLHKFHKFKEKCFNGYNALHYLIYKDMLNYKDVYEMYRIKNAQSPFMMKLSIVKVSKHVKTYSFKYEGDDEWEDEIEMDVTENLNDSDDNNLDGKDNDTLLFKQPSDLKLDVKSNNELEISNEVNNAPNGPKSNLGESNHDFIDNAFFDDIPNLNDTTQEAETEKVTFESISGESNSHNQDKLVSSPSPDEVIDKNAQNEITNEKKHAKINIPKFQVHKKGPSKLSDEYWKKINLTEEEAMQRFEAKALDIKYLDALYKCTQCYKIFAKPDPYNRHLARTHNQLLSFECRFCKMRYRRRHQLEAHMREHYNLYECLRCYYVCPLETNALIHDESHNGKIRKCNICLKEFTHSSTYYSHMTTHRTNFVCTICGRSFVSRHGLNAHKKRTHVNYQNEKPAISDSESWYCSRCDIKFESRAAYDEHVFHSANHSEDIVLDTNNELQRLQRKVLGIREKAVLAEEIHSRKSQTPLVLKKQYVQRGKKAIPMNCHQCGEHFETQSHCRKHHLKEHKGKTFTYGHGNQKRTICEICGLDLAVISMPSHLNTHSREKFYKCDTCGRKFLQKVALKRHMAVHTGEKAFKCTLCEKRFQQPGGRMLHYRTAHLKLPYPKRNRRKKPEIICEDKTEEFKFI